MDAAIIMFFDNYGILAMGARVMAPVTKRSTSYELKGQISAISGQASKPLGMKKVGARFEDIGIFPKDVEILPKDIGEFSTPNLHASRPFENRDSQGRPRWMARASRSRCPKFVERGPQFQSLKDLGNIKIVQPPECTPRKAFSQEELLIQLLAAEHLDEELDD
ncbi:hypothetical protein B0H13DRAFT_1882322 [Mycena leptocephala]|nr:hypothetical protein B0H13DRAFT_1882322 [Mycena leptocephala]